MRAKMSFVSSVCVSFAVEIHRITLEPRWARSRSRRDGGREIKAYRKESKQGPAGTLRVCWSMCGMTRE